MPGSGKSTLGKQLAHELMLLFVDLDQEIEHHEGKTVSEIFREKGEDYFRMVESQLLMEWAGSDRSFVMATGGGAPCFFGGMETINQSGLSIFLDVSVDDIVKRLEKKSDRPLLETKSESEKREQLTLIREKRLSVYKTARITLQHPTLGKLLDAVHFKK